jgi:hypothetical protein
VFERISFLFDPGGRSLEYHRRLVDSRESETLKFSDVRWVGLEAVRGGDGDVGGYRVVLETTSGDVVSLCQRSLLYVSEALEVTALLGHVLGLEGIPIPEVSALRSLRRGREREGVIILRDCYRISSGEAKRRLSELATNRDSQTLGYEPESRRW